MSKFILVFVMVLSSASVSSAFGKKPCPFSNMSANSTTGLLDQTTNAYNRIVQSVPSAKFVQPVKRIK